MQRARAMFGCLALATTVACGRPVDGPYAFPGGLYDYETSETRAECTVPLVADDPVNAAVFVGGGRAGFELPIAQPDEPAFAPIGVLLEGEASSRSISVTHRRANPTGAAVLSADLVLDDESRLLEQTEERVVLSIERRHRVEGDVELFPWLDGPCDVAATYELRLVRACDDACVRRGAVGDRLAFFCPCAEAQQ